MKAGTIVTIACVSAGLVFTGAWALRFLEQEPTQPDGRTPADLAELVARLDRLEQALDERFDHSGRWSVPPSGPERVVESSVPQREPEQQTMAGDEESRLTELGTRVEALELQVRGLLEDPVERGFAYLSSSSPELRQRGIDLLARLARSDPRSREAIRTMLADPDAEVREEALEALEDIDDRDSVPRILALVTDSEAEVREQALRTLGDLLRDGEARPAPTRSIIGALGDADSDVREEAIETLGALGDPAAVAPLRSLYETGADEHRLDAAMALWRLGDLGPFRKEASQLVATLTDTNASERDRGRAAEILGSVARDEYREVLESMLEDPSPRVRREVEQALRGRNDRWGGP